MGPLSARSHAGQELIAIHPGPDKPAGRGRQEIDDQRRPTDGYAFGAFRPATGEALTTTDTSRSIKNFIDFRLEFVFPPVYAACLHLIEPWWKTLESLALKGREFLTWEAVEEAVGAACAYWNAHRHPFVWGKRRRRRMPRMYGIACIPKATGI